MQYGNQICQALFYMVQTPPTEIISVAHNQMLIRLDK